MINVASYKDYKHYFLQMINGAEAGVVRMMKMWDIIYSSPIGQGLYLSLFRFFRSRPLE